MRPRIYLVFAFLLLTGSSIQAGQQPGDPIGEGFFPPELVLQHQQEIKLSEEQRSMLKAETRKVQARFTELQWQLQDEAERMVAEIKQPKVDEQRVLAQLDKILNVEREIKRLQIALAVKIKNSLTIEQQTLLQELRNRSR